MPSGPFNETDAGFFSSISLKILASSIIINLA
jgi:hypothetical protein